MPSHMLLDSLFDLLIEQGFNPAEDVSFIGVTEPLFSGTPVEAQYCKFLAQWTKRYRGIELRVSPYARPALNAAQLRGHVALRMTPNTRDLVFGKWLKALKAQAQKNQTV